MPPTSRKTSNAAGSTEEKLDDDAACTQTGDKANATAITHAPNKLSFAEQQFRSSFGLLRKTLVGLAGLCVCFTVAVPPTATMFIIVALTLLTLFVILTWIGQDNPEHARQTFGRAWLLAILVAWSVIHVL